MIDLSIIIVSYNTRKVTKKCIESIINTIANCQLSTEIIVVDNNSTDGSILMLEQIKNKLTISKKLNQKLIIIKNKSNVGFAQANNQAEKIAAGRYLLFINSDVIFDYIDLQALVNYMEQEKQVGGLTVKVILVNGEIDPACHRGFPTLWRSFCYFSQLEKIFARVWLLNRIFGGYHLLGRDLNQPHAIDSPSGAFYLTRKAVFNQAGRFDEQFFMYGEDLDLSYRIKQLGYQIIYYPSFQVTHLKYQSGLRTDNYQIKKKTKKYFYEAMRIFYQKHYASRYPVFINRLIYWGIKYLENNRKC